MAKRRSRRRPRKVDEVLTEAEEPEEEEVVEEAPKRRTRRTRRKQHVQELVEAAEEAADEPEEDPEEAPKRRRSRTVRVKRKDDDEPLVEQEPEPAGAEEISNTVRSQLPQTLNMALEGQLVLDMLENMREGETYVIGRVDENQWRIAISKEALVVNTPKRLKGAEYYKEVTRTSFRDHEKDWRKLSEEEKWERIDESGVEWNQDDNPRIDLMRATMAYRDHLAEQEGFDSAKEWKYRDAYQERAARQAIKA